MIALFASVALHIALQITITQPFTTTHSGDLLVGSIAWECQGVSYPGWTGCAPILHAPTPEELK